MVLSNIGYAGDLEMPGKVPGIDIIISGGTKRFMKRPVVKGRTLVTSGYYEGRAMGRLVVQMEGGITGWASREELAFMDRQISEAEGGAGKPKGQAKLDALIEKRATAVKQTLYEPDMVHLDPSIPDDPQVAGMITEYRKSASAPPYVSSSHGQRKPCSPSFFHALRGTSPCASHSSK